MKTKIIAHRGAWKEFGLPENSVAALLKAIDEKIEGVELDIHVTRDQQFVVFHDDFIGGKPVVQYSREELQSFLLENGEPVPFLEEFFEYTSGKKMHLVIELKTNSVQPEQTTASALALGKFVMDRAQDHSFEFILFDWDAACLLKEHFPFFTVSYLNGDKTVKEIKEKRLDGIDYHFSLFLSDNLLIEECRIQQLRTNAWTVNDLELAGKLIEEGICCITSDNPVKLRDFFDTKEPLNKNKGQIS